MNRSDKQKEIISDSNATGNKNEPCPENETPCPEEHVQEKEDNKPVEEAKVDKSNPENETDSHTSENGLIGKAFSSKTIKGMVGKEVTWTAVAAIGGAIILIWNIIRYTFLLVSSYIMHNITNVPIYLLMMRKNTDFTDGYIFYGTFMVLLALTNPLKYLSKKTKTQISFICTLLFVILIFLFFILFVCFKLSYMNILFFGIFGSYQELAIYKQIVLLLEPIVLLPLSLVEESDTTAEIEIPVVHEEPIAKSNPKHKRKCQLQLSEKIKQIIWTIHRSLFSSKPRTNLSTQKNSQEGFSFRRFFIVVFTVILLFFAGLPMEGLLDQNGRFIVADLGDRYIVQPAVYEHDEYILTLDNSRYYVINSNNESVNVIKIHPFNSHLFNLDFFNLNEK